MTAIRNGYADTADGQLHYRSVAGPGTPLILLHRTPVTSASFASMLVRLAGKRRAVAFDTPGFGASFAPAGKPAARDYALWFLAGIDALEIGPFHLVGHHTGTHFAAELALAAGKRCRSLLLSGVLHAGPRERLAMRRAIGPAQPIEPDGRHLGAMWTIMQSMLGPGDPALVHAETIGAMTAFAGRDQAFDAILDQDFAGVVAQVRCPLRVLQACDDPLMPMLARLRAARPDVPVDLLGPAGLAAPERQGDSFADAALRFAALSETPDPAIALQGSLMTDRRYNLVRTPDGFDLELVQAPRPSPGPGEVLVRIRAASLNRRDIGVRDLSYPVAPDADRFVPLSDAAGEVVALGEGVTGLAVGDRVCSTFFAGWQDGKVDYAAMATALGVGGNGVLAEYVVFPVAGIAPLPAGWSFAEGATLACAGVTAWSALMRLGQLEPGDQVLIIGTGGVALFALQIAVAAGARAIVLSSSDAKLARAAALGAAATVNYRDHPDWPALVRELSGGGVDHAIELGGVGTLERSIASMAPGGHIALIGALDGFGGDVSAIALIMGALRVSAVLVGSHADHDALAGFMTGHALRPVIDSSFAFADADQAYARAAKGAFGKVVIELDD